MIYYEKPSPEGVAVHTTTGTGKGRRGLDDERDENSVDRLLNLLSSPSPQRIDSQTDNYPRHVTTDSTIYYSNSNSNNYNTNSSCSGSNTKTSYYKPPKDSDLPIVVDSAWVRDRVSSWDSEVSKFRSSSVDTRDSNDSSLPHTGAGHSGNTMVFQRNSSSGSSSGGGQSSGPLSFGSLSGARIGDLSLQPSTKGFLPEKIGSSSSINGSSAVSSTLGGSYSSSSKARYALPHLWLFYLYMY